MRIVAQPTGEKWNYTFHILCDGCGKIIPKDRVAIALMRICESPDEQHDVLIVHDRACERLIKDRYNYVWCYFEKFDLTTHHPFTSEYARKERWMPQSVVNSQI